MDLAREDVPSVNVIALEARIISAILIRVNANAVLTHLEDDATSARQAFSIIRSANVVSAMVARTSATRKRALVLVVEIIRLGKTVNDAWMVITEILGPAEAYRADLVRVQVALTVDSNMLPRVIWTQPLRT